MGESTKMKKYILISGFNAHDNNRGTAALSYGSLIFCVQQKILRKNRNY